jgi:hypothetical protein
MTPTIAAEISSPKTGCTEVEIVGVGAVVQLCNCKNMSTASAEMLQAHKPRSTRCEVGIDAKDEMGPSNGAIHAVDSEANNIAGSKTSRWMKIVEELH